jgi:hypothetical protein
VSFHAFPIVYSPYGMTLWYFDMKGKAHKQMRYKHDPSENTHKINEMVLISLIEQAKYPEYSQVGFSVGPPYSDIFMWNR